ncbi:hypothetical protein GQ44DRAFT_700203 [Phaeosphaeriaceae sp. PMI808]|nr:hypothetical protein GQ44DRAFT_700203 [Phaeosphaeriaceae sp. PMI808]
MTHRSERSWFSQIRRLKVAIIARYNFAQQAHDPFDFGDSAPPSFTLAVPRQHYLHARCLLCAQHDSFVRYCNTALKDILMTEPKFDQATPPTTDAQSDPRPMIVLHKNGDAILRIGPLVDQQMVQVSRSVMVLASPVWRAMLEGPQWTESTAAEIPFLDDDVDAMLIVLRIAHLLFKELPRKEELPLEDLLHLAIVCDKYDLVGLVRPFLDLYSWAEVHRPNFKKKTNCNHSWLFVAWTFGYTDSFESLMIYMVKEMILESDDVIIVNGTKLLSIDLPPEALEGLVNVYKGIISELANTCHKFIDLIAEGDSCTAKDRRGERLDPLACRTMLLGSLMEKLIKWGLFPKPTAGKYIKTSLTVICCDSPLFREHYTSYRLSERAVTHHNDCRAPINDLKAQINGIVNSMPSPMLHSHRIHMEEQAKK